MAAGSDRRPRGSPAGRRVASLVRPGSRSGTTLALLLTVGLPVTSAGNGFRTGETDLVMGRYAPPYGDPSDSLIVVSYNIQYGERVEAALADLRSEPMLARADILLLQEMGPEGCDRMARELQCDFVYYPASIHPHHDRLFGNAILTRGRISGYGFTPLPTPGLLAGTPRIAVYADLQFGARRVRAVSVHSSTVTLPAEDRRRQIRTVLDSLASVSDPLVIGGDFNTLSAHDADCLIRDMRRAGLRAARTSRGPTVRQRWLHFLGVGGHLDHIFFKALEVVRAGIELRAAASDHYPVWAILRWPDQPGRPAATTQDAPR